MKRLKSKEILFYAFTIILLGTMIYLYLWMIEWPGRFDAEFTRSDVAKYLPFVGDGEEIFVVKRMRMLGLFALTPFLLLFRHRSVTQWPAWQQILSFCLRFSLLAVIIFALCDVRKQSEVTAKRRTVFAVDTSASISDKALEGVRARIEEALAARQPGDSVEILAFDKEVRRIREIDGKLSNLRSEKVAESDLRAVLRYSYALFPENVSKHLIVFSDGNETRGNVEEEALAAATRGVKISTVSSGEERREILIRHVEIEGANALRVSKPFEYSIFVESTTEQEIAVEAKLEGENFGRESVKIFPGSNEIKMRGLPQRKGSQKLALKIVRFESDTFAENNEFLTKINVLGKSKVLIVEDASISSFLQRALTGANDAMEVELRSGGGLPSSKSDIERYDAVVLSDVPLKSRSGATNVSTAQMEILSRYIRQYGGGFVAVGGENAFGPGGYENTILEKILPVSFKAESKRRDGGIILAIAIDKSSSMSGLKLDMAKEAAKAAVSVLSPQDRVLVIGFDDMPRTYVSLRRATSKKRISDLISSMRSDGGTNIQNALETAYLELALASAKQKHLILLTDGQSDYGRISSLTKEMARARITISTVALGRGADTVLLGRIASNGKGKAYYTADPYAIPRIFVQDTESLTNKAFVEEPFVPRILKNHAMIKGIAFPPLLGFVLTKAKSGSERILDHASSGAPILATWRLGLGKSTVFTSDAKNRWATQWIKSPAFKKFWMQVIRDAMKSDESKTFPMQAVIRDGKARIFVDAVDDKDDFINALRFESEVVLPDDGKKTLRFEQRAAGRYEAEFALPSFGPYEITAKSFDDNDRELAESGTFFSYPYAAEFEFVKPDETLLQKMAELTNGSFNPDLIEIFKAEAEKIKKFEALWPYAVWIALLIIIADVLFRRVRIGGTRRKKT